MIKHVIFIGREVDNVPIRLLNVVFLLFTCEQNMAIGDG